MKRIEIIMKYRNKLLTQKKVRILFDDCQRVRYNMTMEEFIE